MGFVLRPIQPPLSREQIASKLGVAAGRFYKRASRAAGGQIDRHAAEDHSGESGGFPVGRQRGFDIARLPRHAANTHPRARAHRPAGVFCQCAVRNNGIGGIERPEFRCFPGREWLAGRFRQTCRLLVKKQHAAFELRKAAALESDENRTRRWFQSPFGEPPVNRRQRLNYACHDYLGGLLADLRKPLRRQRAVLLNKLPSRRASRNRHGNSSCCVSAESRVCQDSVRLWRIGFARFGQTLQK